tara:strand:- start:322 stop:579 length:258 start_codon:yes stop_codon:yes gene_type:complete
MDDNRYTEIMVEADVEMMYHCGEIHNFTIKDISCLWSWDETSREAAEYWAVWDYVGAHYNFDWMSIKSWTGSPVKKALEPDQRIN